MKRWRKRERGHSLSVYLPLFSFLLLAAAVANVSSFCWLTSNIACWSFTCWFSQPLLTNQTTSPTIYLSNCLSLFSHQLSSCLLTDWLIDSLTDWLTDWLGDWLTDECEWQLHSRMHAYVANQSHTEWERKTWKVKQKCHNTTNTVVPNVAVGSWS